MEGGFWVLGVCGVWGVECRRLLRLVSGRGEVRASVARSGLCWVVVVPWVCRRCCSEGGRGGRAHGSASCAACPLLTAVSSYSSHARAWHTYVQRGDAAHGNRNLLGSTRDTDGRRRLSWLGALVVGCAVPTCRELCGCPGHWGGKVVANDGRVMADRRVKSGVSVPGCWRGLVSARWFGPNWRRSIYGLCRF